MKTEPPIELDQILDMVRWGDYQREDGSWGRGVANKPEVAEALKDYQDQAVKDEAYIAFGIASVSKSLVDFQNDYAKHIENLEANNTGDES